MADIIKYPKAGSSDTAFAVDSLGLITTGVETVDLTGAGSLIVEEAGGIVTDIAGLSLDFSLGKHLSRNQGVLASNGKLHSFLLSGLKAIRPCSKPSSKRE